MNQEAAGLAALRKTSDDVNEINEALHEMEEAVASNSFGKRGTQPLQCCDCRSQPQSCFDSVFIFCKVSSMTWRRSCVLKQ